MSKVLKALDAFLKSDNKVLVIKGDWGVGKTFFWNKYYENNINNLSQLAYSYVSLFGKNSLSDLKKEVFHSAKPIKKDRIAQSFQQQTEEASGIYSYIPWLNPKEKIVHRIPFLKPIVRYADNTPILFRATNAISSLEYSLVNNYLVCFDDLERRGNSLSIKEVMGFIDELAQRKNCKIILIFNEETLHHKDDLDIFNTYREKIVDIEIKYCPTIKDNFNHIFLLNTQHHGYILEIMERLGVNNIRFFKKLKQLLLSYDGNLSHADDEIKKDFILRACILCYGYYIPSKKLSYSELKTRLEKGVRYSFTADKENEKNETDEHLDKLIKNFSLRSPIFISEIDFFLNNGYHYNDAELHDLIHKKNHDITTKRLEQKISSAWHLYQDSFKNNDNEFISTLSSILNTELTNIPLNSFDSIVDMLRNFDVNCDEYINNYFVDIDKRIDLSNRRLGYFLGDLRCQDIQERLKETIRKLKESNRNITSIAIDLAQTNGWNPEDINYLNSFSTHDFVIWIKEQENNSVDLVRNGLLKFRNIQNNDPIYEEITNKVIEALKVIALESKINQLRVKNIFKIDINEQ
ncbi:P-loop NTPase fold protein [Salmonella enterica]|uniref:P-loop NTPase fold protein n=1 Tax=Salmonella enterica TaxID=28901 RepID=UPI0034641C1F